MCRPQLQSYSFLSTPSARRATAPRPPLTVAPIISIHALREEGDNPHPQSADRKDISIHALREEGDGSGSLRAGQTRKFLSTPSARRATPRGFFSWPRLGNFYPRPPRGGRPRGFFSWPRLGNFYPRPPRGGRRRLGAWRRRCTTYFYPRPPRGGRLFSDCVVPCVLVFLSTPSARRATRLFPPYFVHQHISIHALREEGDVLFMELLVILHENFYPRPPRGGRHRVLSGAMPELLFLSTPSARRATLCLFGLLKLGVISIHALREEGDGCRGR